MNHPYRLHKILIMRRISYRGRVNKNAEQRPASKEKLTIIATNDRVDFAFLS